MAKEVFTRYEMKYLIPMDTFKKIREAVMPYVQYDEYGDEGHYRVSSLYFESPDYKIYYETKNKLRYRQKLRMRVYNEVTAADSAFLEIKKKHGKIVNKRRTRVRLQDAYPFIYGQAAEIASSNPQVLKEVKSFMRLYELRPKLVVSYDRQAFRGTVNPDLRMTFDYFLTCRDEDLLLEKGSHGHYFVDPDLVIMEVKVDHSVPFWLAKIISELQCPPKSVSKYCTSMELLDEKIGGTATMSQREVAVGG